VSRTTGGGSFGSPPDLVSQIPRTLKDTSSSEDSLVVALVAGLALKPDSGPPIVVRKETLLSYKIAELSRGGL
jgi:hypothetical protein